MAKPRGGEWLEDEIHALHREGVGMLVSALTKEEISELELTREGEICATAGLQFRNFPLPDRCVPNSMLDALSLASDLEEMLRGEKSVAIHCRYGIGRASLLAACVLTRGGVAVKEAFERIGAARGFPVPDTREQAEWVVNFAKRATVL
jgi:protein-tyrosine phosphatase